MAVSIRELRCQTRQVIQSLRRGERPVITFHGHPLARLVPITRSEKRSIRDIGFGMWKGRSDMKDVDQWLDEQRKPRFSR